MADRPPDVDVSKLDWRQLVEWRWCDLVEMGLPRRLADVAEEVGQSNGRAICIYTMPTIDAGCGSFSVPFMEEDGVIVDPSMLPNVGQLAKTVAYQLAILVNPRWNEVGPEDVEGRREMATAMAQWWIAEDSAAGDPEHDAAVIETMPYLASVHSLRNVGDSERADPLKWEQLCRAEQRYLEFEIAEMRRQVAGPLQVTDADPAESDALPGETTYRFDLPHTR